MTDYTNMTPADIITAILEEHGFVAVGAFLHVPDTAFDVEAFTSLRWFKSVQTPEGWDVIETTQEANNERAQI